MLMDTAFDVKQILKRSSRLLNREVCVRGYLRQWQNTDQLFVAGTKAQSVQRIDGIVLRRQFLSATITESPGIPYRGEAAMNDRCFVMGTLVKSPVRGYRFALKTLTCLKIYVNRRPINIDLQPHEIPSGADLAKELDVMKQEASQRSTCRDLAIAVSKKVDLLWYSKIDPQIAYDDYLLFAIEYLRKSVKQFRNDYALFNNLGALLCNHGEHAEARKLFEKAMKLHDNDIHVYQNIGIVDTLLGDRRNKCELPIGATYGADTFRAYIDWHAL
ncbi:MAG: hypothetical protein CMJ78_10170 [Planctomycetaceae bacterium]|nr:hypothetical protein [Planctomycetaceae bacterium]